MNALEQYLQKLDKSNYDCKDADTINKEFQQVIKQLSNESENKLAKTADLDRQVFSVQKSFKHKLDKEKGTSNGLSWKMSGRQTFEDGSEAPLYWPNVSGYSKEDFEYFEKRYVQCKNLFVKTEYGLMVYFGEKTSYSKHHDFKKQLFRELFALSKNYFKKTEMKGKKNHYSLYFFHTLTSAFQIAEKAKFASELSNIIQFMYEVHQKWDVTKDGTLRILLDISGLMSDYFKLVNKEVDFQKIIEKNIKGAKKLEKTHLWGAIYAVNTNLKIEQKRGKPLEKLLQYKAQLYEKLAKDAECKTNMACISFAEDALRIYEQLKDPSSIQRMEKYYTELRGKFQHNEIKQEMSMDFSKELSERITRSVSELDEIGIIHTFIMSPWYNRVETIKNLANDLKKESVLLSIVPTTILDKFGNTVDIFSTDEEKELINFWQTYSFQFQIGSQTMHAFFIEAFKTKKLHYESVIAFLESSWLNEPIQRKYHGEEVIVKPLDTIRPALKKLFGELDSFFANNNHQQDYVTITDSLTLKIEGILRCFCEKLGIATLKTRNRQKGAHKIVMEKILDELLADLEHKPILKPDQETNFNEDDRILIKYVMSEKVGYNLRNKVAHGLMDIFEYSFENLLILFCIILKLSKYKFVKIKGGKDESDS